MMISGLICMLLGTTGCNSLPWTKKKDNIYSPKPAHQRLNKNTKKANSRPSNTVDGFLSSERVSW
ncbi:MAG: hypothetical protein FWC43_05220 [Planctomycetaceae bacterium]|nr:hypothetical protein [Planctomycetaceae bacterium]